MFSLFEDRKPSKACKKEVAIVHMHPAAFNTEQKLKKTLHKFQGQTMGTHFSVSFVGEQHINLLPIQQAVQAAVDEVDSHMSTWKSDSALSRFNLSLSREWMDVPGPLAYVVSEALKLSALTEGAFDVTLGSAVNLWGFGPKGAPRQPPDSDKIHDSKAASGYEKLKARLEPPALRKTSECYVDLSGIAKGFAVDQMAQVLDDKGIRDYLVAIDGEVRVRGSKVTTNTPWTIAVESPVPNARQAYDLLQARDCAIATSGDYRHFVIFNNKHYCHTIDSTSGRPIDNNVGSVTVSHRSCMMADAWATALMVLGPDKGVELANAHHIPALFLLTTDSGIHEIVTPEFAALIDW